MKKILIFSLAYYPRHVSGAEAAVKEITDRISDIDFHMVTLRFDAVDSRYERIGKVEVHRVGVGNAYISKILFIPLAAIKAFRLHRKVHFDAAWGLMTYMLFPIAIARLMGMRAPIVLSLQDGDPYEKVFGRLYIRPLLPLLNYGFRATSIVQAISTYLSYWPKRRGFHGRVEVIRNGANPRDLAQSVGDDEVRELQLSLGKKYGDLWLVNTSRLEHQKANDDTIRALRLLPPNIKLLLVGGGSDEALLRKLADEIGVAERVMFIGQVERSEVTKYRRAGDIFVCPSRSEGLGLAFLSAMASKIPVIATQEGGLADFIFDAKRNPEKPTTAWAVDANSPRQIAEAIQDIIADPESVQEVTERAREMIVAEYNWDAIAVQMRTRVFASVLK